MYKKMTIVALIVVLVAATIILNSLTSKDVTGGHDHDHGSKPPTDVSADAPPTERLFAAVHSGNYEVIDELLAEDPDLVNELHSMRGTFTNCATTAGDRAMLEYLLDRGAHPDGNAECGVTSLQIAVSNGDIGCAELLIERGATVNLVVGDKSLLDIAVENGSEPMIELLKKSGGKTAKDLPKPHPPAAGAGAPGAPPMPPMPPGP